MSFINILGIIVTSLLIVYTEGCDEGFFKVDGSTKCFKLIKEYMDWDAAQSRCAAEGLQLAHNTDQMAIQLQRYLYDHYGDYTYVWLGGRSTTGRDGPYFWYESTLTPTTTTASPPGRSPPAGGGGGGSGGGVNYTLSRQEGAAAPGLFGTFGLGADACVALQATESGLREYPGRPYYGDPCSWPLSSSPLCQDIDECSSNNGGRGPCAQDCHNSVGSYRCSCGNGDTLSSDGKNCQAPSADGTVPGKVVVIPENDSDFLEALTGASVSSSTSSSIVTPSVSGSFTGLSPCTFPFIYKGVSYSKCTSFDDPDGSLWCSTQTDDQNNHLKDQYKHCTEDDVMKGGDNHSSLGTCGHSMSPPMIGERIANGRPTIPGQYPWMVHLRYFSRYLGEFLSCGGTIINSGWVLTAAHCFRDLDEDKEVIMKIGYTDLLRYEKGANLFAVTRSSIKIHGGFSPDTLENDIALIRLPNKVTFNNVTQPICLGQARHIPYGSTAFALGWGLIKPSGNIPNHLQEVELDVLSKSDSSCSNHLQFICTFTPGKDTCSGDSGGPLMVQEGTAWYQVGIVSHGPLDCGSHSSPGVYTKIASHMPFILGNAREASGKLTF